MLGSVQAACSVAMVQRVIGSRLATRTLSRTPVGVKASYQAKAMKQEPHCPRGLVALVLCESGEGASFGLGGPASACYAMSG
jgi:hypothetical protein